MVFLSAFDDFVLRTLAAMPSLLARLQYLAQLHDGDAYRHWGLERVHGQPAAAQAIARAHTDIWRQVLRTPVPELFDQLQGDAFEGWDLPRQGWNAEAPELLPAELGGGSKAHFSSVLASLAELSAAARESTRPAA